MLISLGVVKGENGFLVVVSNGPKDSEALEDPESPEDLKGREDFNDLLKGFGDVSGKSICVELLDDSPLIVCE